MAYPYTSDAVYIGDQDTTWYESLIGIIPGLIDTIWGNDTTQPHPPVMPPVTPPANNSNATSPWVWVAAGFGGIILIGIIL